MKRTKILVQNRTSKYTENSSDETAFFVFA